jgi:hypothetical protein
MEQAAYVGTLQRMGKKGFVDFDRVMMLRSASNYSTPPTGQDVTTTIGDESLGTEAAFEAQYRAGSVVVHKFGSERGTNRRPHFGTGIKAQGSSRVPARSKRKNGIVVFWVGFFLGKTWRMQVGPNSV